MVAIGNVEVVMAALRARLQRLARDTRSARAGPTARGDAARSESGTIGSLRQLPPREFDRALVGLLLERELGEGLAADPRFNALIERTSAILDDDPEIRALFREVQGQAP